MQHISKFGRACVLAAALVAAILSAPVVAIAENDGSFSGTVIDPSGSSRVGGDGRRRATNAPARSASSSPMPTAATSLTGLRPSIYTITVTFQGFAPLEYTGMQLAAAQEFALDLTLQAGRRHRGGHRRRQRHGDRPQLGAHRRQRQRARSAEPAGQRPADVAADAAGAGLAERRHRHLERRPLQRPRQPAERHQVRRRRGLGHHRRLAGQHRTARSPRRSSCRRASRTCRSSASSRTTTRPSSAPAPAARSASSPSRARNQFRGSLFEYYRNDKLDAPNYFDSTRNTDGSVIQELPKSTLNQHQFGGSLGGPLLQEPRVLLRQLRGLPARRRRELRRSGAERRGLGARGAGDRGAAARRSRRRARCSCRARRPTPTSTSTSCRALEKVEENSFSVRLDFRLNDQLVVLRPRLPRPRHAATRRKASAAASSRSTNKPTNAIFNLQGTARRRRC